MPSLLAISIGPVQDFIAAARTTRDLWFGSMLLSQISRAAAQRLQAGGAALIFPAPDALASDAAIANKLLALVDGADSAVLAAEAQTAAQACLDEYRDGLIDDLRRKGIGNEVNWDLLSRQVEQFIEFYAAWVSFEGDDQYANARRDVELLLAGRKALRDFGPATGLAGVPKSSLDPSRESVVQKGAATLRSRLHLKPSEQLDGISLIKRVAPQRPLSGVAEQRFVSVSRVALDPFIRLLEGGPELSPLNHLASELDRAGVEVERFEAGAGSRLHQFAAFPYDSEIFYHDGSQDRHIPAAQQPLAAEFYRTVRHACARLGLGDPPAYLAVLQADGDRMGKAIAGMKSPEQHQQLSAALAAFAAAAEGIVARHQGALVYSGGDDVLAFLPLDKALGCADALRLAFAEHTSPIVEQGATLSVGVAIGHYGEQLDELRRWAREAEQDAKKLRNALAVSLHTRSGGAEVTVCHAWTNEPVVQYWRLWIEAYADEAIPRGAAYELRTLAREFKQLLDHDAGKSSSLDPEILKALTAEAERILKRKRTGHGAHALSDDVIKRIKARLGSLAELERVVDELLIARHLAPLGVVASDASVEAAYA